MLKRNIADLVQDTDSMQRVFLAIKDISSPDLINVLCPLFIIEDLAPLCSSSQIFGVNRFTCLVCPEV